MEMECLGRYFRLFSSVAVISVMPVEYMLIHMDEECGMAILCWFTLGIGFLFDAKM